MTSSSNQYGKCGSQAILTQTSHGFEVCRGYHCVFRPTRWDDRLKSAFAFMRVVCFNVWVHLRLCQPRRGYSTNVRRACRQTLRASTHADSMHPTPSVRRIFDLTRQIETHPSLQYHEMISKQPNRVTVLYIQAGPVA